MSNHQPNEPSARSIEPRRLGVPIGAMVLTLLGAVACLGFSYWIQHKPGPDLAPTPRTSLILPEKRALFNGWDKPDLVFVLSAEEHGYLLPCGCSSPQKGGDERRYNFIQILRDKGWTVVPLGLGDVAQSKPPVEVLTNLQQDIKYKYAMMNRKAMDYAAVGVGPIEASNLFKLYGAYPLQEDKPRVLSANLRSRAEAWVPGIEEWLEITPPGSDIKVGVTSIMGAYNAERRPKDDKVQFDFGGDALKAVLKKNGDKVNFRVVLYEGYITIGKNKKPEAIACAVDFPEVQLMVALSGEFDEPPGAPLVVKHEKTGGTTPIVTLGHKGKYVGVLGVFKTGDKKAPYSWKYQLVELGEEYITPKGEEKDHPILKLMEDYATEVKNGDFLAQNGQRKHPLQVDFPGKKKPEYAGTNACQGCHAGAFKIWEKTDHSKAYQTLVNAKRPSNRQYDPECIVCHTVGFGYESGFFDEKKTNYLQNVGCESCHGPGQGHIDAEVGTGDKGPWREAINHTKYVPEAQRKSQIEQMCMKCHDQENDVHWTGEGAFAKHWEVKGGHAEVPVMHYKVPPKPAPNPVVPDKPHKD